MPFWNLPFSLETWGPSSAQQTLSTGTGLPRPSNYLGRDSPTHQQACFPKAPWAHNCPQAWPRPPKGSGFLHTSVLKLATGPPRPCRQKPWDPAPHTNTSSGISLTPQWSGTWDPMGPDSAHQLADTSPRTTSVLQSAMLGFGPIHQ